MKNVFSKATTITGLALVGAMCFGTLPANATFTPIQSTTFNTVTEAEATPNATFNLKHREQVTEIFNLVNEYRVANGQKALMFSVPASEESQKWSNTMAAEKRMYHNSNPGTDPRITAVPWDRWAENVAGRWDGDGAKMFQQWVDSPGHNVNLLSPNVNTIGIGMAVTGNKDFQNDPSNYYMWGTQNFYNFTGKLPALTYASPDDYFEGRPSLDSQQAKEIVVKRPAVNYETANYTLHPIEGVDYYVNGVKKTPGTYFSNWEKVTIEYRALPGYIHTTTNNKYSVVIDFTQYLRTTVAASPEFFAKTGKYTINESVGVNYTVNGVTKAPGTYDSGWTKVNVVATAKAGYKLSGTTTWSYTFTKPSTPTPTPTPTPKPTPTPTPTPTPAPVIKVTPAEASFNKAAGKYTIPATTGVQYKVNGSNVQKGTYSGLGKKIAITAVAKTGYQISGKASWTYKFVNDTNAQDFKDTKGTAFAKEIRWMRASGISTGWADNTYQPYSNIKRDAMAAFIYRMAGSPAYTPPAKSPFKDVATNNMYYKEITWLASTGITTGWADGTFRPMDNVNRDAMAAFMYRYGSMCHIKAVDGYKAPSTKKFNDTPVGMAFYKEMSWMGDAAISTGWSDRTYRPLQAVTREEMGAFLSRLDTYIAKNGGC